MTDQQEFPVIPHKETLPTETQNRVLVLGSRISGAFEIGEALQEYLKQMDVLQPTVEVQRDAGYIEKYVLGRDTVDEGRADPNLPNGVILLPEMRQYDSLTGKGMFLQTYSCGVSSYVEDLCRQYQIPLVEIRELKSPEQIMDGIKQLLEKPREE